MIQFKPCVVSWSNSFWAVIVITCAWNESVPLMLEVYSSLVQLWWIYSFDRSSLHREKCHGSFILGVDYISAYIRAIFLWICIRNTYLCSFIFKCSLNSIYSTLGDTLLSTSNLSYRPMLASCLPKQMIAQCKKIWSVCSLHPCILDTASDLSKYLGIWANDQCYL